jgi:hypothetical protein
VPPRPSPLEGGRPGCQRAAHAGERVPAGTTASRLPAAPGGVTWTLGLHSDAITRCRDQLGGIPSVPCPLGMDLTAWFGPQGVLSSGDPARGTNPL